MRIVTPENAAFQPSGIGGGGFSGMPLLASYSLTEDVNADFGPITVPLFTPPDGSYFWAAFVKTNVASAGGSITITLEQPGSLSTINMVGSLSIVGLAGSAHISVINSPLFAADGIFNVVREVTGFAGGPANYSVYVNMYLLVG